MSIYQAPQVPQPAFTFGDERLVDPWAVTTLQNTCNNLQVQNMALQQENAALKNKSQSLQQQRENPLAVLGGTDAGTGADQKGKTQLCLQGLDDITESGLGVPQLFRRPCQVAQVNGGEQGHAFVLVHGASFPGRDRGEPFGSIGKSNDKGGFSLFYKGKWV